MNVGNTAVSLNLLLGCCHAGVVSVDKASGVEYAATEFKIQSLEIDWACVAWDADLRYVGTGWQRREFHCDRWTRIANAHKQRYLKNVCRVLLTRARQGMVIFVPEGDPEDGTRNREFYDGTYRYLLEAGIREIRDRSA